jgi:murein DD-endopeptidase MepM/ murein hydrolase activator NlpD
MTPAEKRRFLQLAVCCGAFVLLVGVKLLLPEQAERLRASVSGVLERNMDVAEVFSAVGKAVSGEKTVGETLGDVYQAVFRPVEPVKTGYVDAAAVEALEPLRAFADGEGSATAWLPAGEASSAAEDSSPDTMDAAEEPEQAMELSAVLYSGENLPANVSMEQMVLGFDYCTPVQGTVSSNFGYRSHPIEGEEKFHYGLDIAADSGTEIDCFADGVVTAVGDSTSYGKYCIVSHEGGYSTLYAHCSRVTATSGASVTEGQKIAEVGETGMATGPHLHFELQENETYLNPVYYVSLA